MGSRLPKNQRNDQPASRRFIIPMHLQFGDRYTDEAGEWEVVSRPVSFHGGKSVRVWVRVPGWPDTERENTWEAHQRITVRRG